MSKFKDYQKNCPWKKGRWCRPILALGAGGGTCKSTNCPFWCLRNLIINEETKSRTV